MHGEGAGRVVCSSHMLSGERTKRVIGEDLVRCLATRVLVEGSVGFISEVGYVKLERVEVSGCQEV